MAYFKPSLKIALNGLITFSAQAFVEAKPLELQLFESWGHQTGTPAQSNSDEALLVVRALDCTEAVMTITNLKPLATASKTDNSQGHCHTQTAGRVLASLSTGKQQCT